MPGLHERNLDVQNDPASKELARKFFDSPTIFNSMRNDLLAKGLPVASEHPLGKKHTRIAQLNDPNAKYPVDIFIEITNPEEICLFFETGSEQSALIFSMWERNGEYPIDHIRKVFDSQETNFSLELRACDHLSSTVTEFREYYSDGKQSSWHAFCPQAFALIFLNLVKPRQKVTPCMEAVINKRPCPPVDIPVQPQQLYPIGTQSNTDRYLRNDTRVEKKISVADAVIAQLNSDRNKGVTKQQAGSKSRFERTADKKAKVKARKNKNKRLKD